MTTYSDYIELSPHYESVVDQDSETRHPDLWQEYIVHEDMVEAVEKICLSIRNQQKDDRRSFWIHGAYGTGKSYAGIVLKHLFEDRVEDIETFFERKQKLKPLSKDFLAIRKRGKFLVVWETGCTGIRNGVSLMMKMEVKIRQQLQAVFGDQAYYGKTSLIQVVQQKLNDPTFNWEHIFRDPSYGLAEDYASFTEFRELVQQGALEECARLAKILLDKGIALFNSVDAFEAWLKDVIEGNGLSQTGIVFIWDEFTEFVREAGDDNLLQRLAEYCKQQPFFMFLIVHVGPDLKAKVGEQNYTRILHRYHTLEFHVSEAAAYELIANSILVRPGMERQWEDEKNKLLKTLDGYWADLDDLTLNNPRSRQSELCPIHPMTLSLLTIVAQNFGASQRTLFRFMKDRHEAEQKVGFVHYISTHGPQDWRWLTPDFLWDYFFTRSSDVSDEISKEARQVYHYYLTKREFVEKDPTAEHVFKAIMLLLAVFSMEKVSYVSQGPTKKPGADRRTLVRCFVGQLTEAEIDHYLELFEKDGLIHLYRRSVENVGLELPHQASQDAFLARVEKLRKENTRQVLFGNTKAGVFATSLAEKIWPKDRATANRMKVLVCAAETHSLKTRYEELSKELERTPYKIGLLVVVISSPTQMADMRDKLKQMAREEESRRMVFCLLKDPFTDDKLENWLQNMAHYQLAEEEGKKAGSAKYLQEAEKIFESWAVSAKDGEIFAAYGEREYTFYGQDDLVRKVEGQIVFDVFPAAPERLVNQYTVFKPSQEKAALAAITRQAKDQQIRNIEHALQGVRVWDVQSLDELVQCDQTDAALVVVRLAQFIRERLSSGTKIRLDSLWEDLQKPPFGYYNSLACAYLLGYVLRFYKDKEFNWVDNANGVFPLNEKHLATMIDVMCKGNAQNHTLSAGSQVWQSFRIYAKSLFSLKDEEVVSEEQARKFMRLFVTERMGVPLWALQYLPSERFAGEDERKRLVNILSGIGVFLAGPGDTYTQNQIDQQMENVVAFFKGQSSLRKQLTDWLCDRPTCADSFWRFVISKQPELEGLATEIGLNAVDCLDAVRQLMPSTIYNWTEEEVAGRLQRLTLDYRLIAGLNRIMNGKRKSVSEIERELKNCFEHMKVPGQVIETLQKEWLPGLRWLYHISTGGWRHDNDEEKQTSLNCLGDAQTAYRYVSDSVVLLAEYLCKLGKEVSDTELQQIFDALPPANYGTSEIMFERAVQAELEKIAYGRDRKELLQLWEQGSGYKTVREWCNAHEIPVQWLMEQDVARTCMQTLKTVQNGQRVGQEQLKTALAFFRQFDFSFLQQSEKIRQCWQQKLGVDCVEEFFADQQEILKAVRARYGDDVCGWEYRATDIRGLVQEFSRRKAREQYGERVRASVSKMNDGELRARVLRLLQERPELSEWFIQEEKPG